MKTNRTDVLTTGRKYVRVQIDLVIETHVAMTEDEIRRNIDVDVNPVNETLMTVWEEEVSGVQVDDR